MERSCDLCGTAYTPQRATSKYCGTTCRTRATRARQSGRPILTKFPSPAAPRSLPDPDEDGLVASTRRQLEQAGRLDTIAGQTALLLAQRLAEARSMDTGSSLAAVSKELRSVVAEALAGVAVEDDPVDELRRRRELKLSG